MGDTHVLKSALLAGGGTAGHVNPLLAVADELVRTHPGLAVTVLGTREGLESDLVPARGYPLSVVPKVPLPRRPSVAWFRLPGRLRAAVRAAGEAIDTSGAQVVVGFGGYVSTPAYLAARRRGVPVVIHEQNARPGLANRLGARWARSVAVTFPSTALPGAVVTGLPLRREVAALVDERASDAAGSRAAAAARLGLDPALPVLVVTGGSLGAQRLNETVSALAELLTSSGAQVLHLTGRGKSAPVAAAVSALPGGLSERYQVREYLDEMHLAYAVADLVVCRSGAGTVCELTALGLPAVYVPLPVGNGEQRLNAAAVVEAGGGLLVADADLTPAWVTAHVVPLLTDPAALSTMSSAAAGVGVPDAAGAVAALVERAASEVSR
ncbi:UDP-N-acetylglucosamine--N-acetylmuramyl-(pentapeptide) pyrophosphoryl-undecaprenol N-acetylglucosamine transferase [Sanguibacter keddieii DSM 10542]|uniref:UDP-N-acetylglucosamine--N-acetylmuramyl-(pentapeptide) pyrophosphoryl-undecaprenol N-acetylglucosamine transferase n=1 Tax=Sanguibacter keddieii (strain ATCC 51767 / DSM 10542 / NCFB 3025 / ST-74) TaxID=446469 RepID=D1BIL8_SANKS|nr:undecaprenyldiphospho-muramoylpentapeptide beta-N-acetylglucosaminyltransferase [Sanguibacter keddieii]ACZ22195.1 UDP-N-acetylglucosamine--N-acetylmuramyl-(pentapeptide) pyrophosphoryl-undecaprenol N-acetylglucosamine transferase [Sanguibacter keddieii DSM 10542]